ncbi:MAG: amidohydrolase [Bryobacterales bacterium]|nr:amidohydrolase [Bryobacterales bacterium]
MKAGFPLYDSHAHLGTARHSGRVHTAEMLLRSMDGAGVDRALLIPFPVVDDYRREHDLIAAAVRAYPDRFSGAACVYPFIPEHEFRAEVKRCAEELGFCALKLQPQYHGLNPVSNRSDFFFATALRHKLPVIVHTGSGVPFTLPSLYIMPARRFPDLPIVLGHAGSPIYALETIVAASVCPNIYIELSSLMPHHMTEILVNVSADRLMVGADLPESLETEMHKILFMDLPDGMKRKILWETPRRLFDRA